jgi:hypothetical protein
LLDWADTHDIENCKTSRLVSALRAAWSNPRERQQQVDQQGTTGLAEGQVSQFIEDDQVGACQAQRDLTGFASGFSLFECVHQLDRGQETHTPMMTAYRFGKLLRGSSPFQHGNLALSGPFQNVFVHLVLLCRRSIADEVRHGRRCDFF